MKEKSCSDFHSQLLDYLVGELKAGEEEEELKNHLASCPRCRRELDELSRVWQSLKALTRVRFSPQLSQSVLEEVSRRQKRFFVLPFRLGVWPGVYRWAAAGLVAAAGFLLILHFSGWFRRPVKPVADYSASTFYREHKEPPDVDLTLNTYLHQAGDFLVELDRGNYDTWQSARNGIFSFDLQGQANFLLQNLPAESPARPLVRKLHEAFWRILKAGRGREDKTFRLPPGVNIPVLRKEINNYRNYSGSRVHGSRLESDED